jgi:hypothetical protein
LGWRRPATQGSSFLATLGFVAESLWDSSNANADKNAGAPRLPRDKFSNATLASSSVKWTVTGTIETLHAPGRGKVEAEIERLKQDLLRPIIASVANVELVKALSWAANEAAGLAWLTVCPNLVLPALLEEKMHETMRKWEKQEQVRRR